MLDGGCTSYTQWQKGSKCLSKYGERKSCFGVFAFHHPPGFLPFCCLDSLQNNSKVVKSKHISITLTVTRISITRLIT